MVPSRIDLNRLAVAWRLSDDFKKLLPDIVKGYKTSIVKRLDECLTHWFTGEETTYDGQRKLTAAEARSIIGDDKKLRRIFAPVDVLADTVWDRAQARERRWIMAFTSRAATYLTNAAPLLKNGKKLNPAQIDQWYFFCVG